MARNARGRGYARISSRALEMFTNPQQHLAFRVVTFVIRLRAELVCFAVVLTAQIMLTKAGIPARWAGVTLLVILSALLVIPVSRRFLTRRWWAVMSRHRMRDCFTETRTMTHAGRLPYLWWSRPSPVGERVRVWLPAGLSVKDIEAVADELAAACVARDARIQCSKRFAASVVVEIVRRDPLTSATPLRPHVVDTLREPVANDGTIVALPNREDIAAAQPTNEHGYQGTHQPRTHQAVRTSGSGAPRRSPHPTVSRSDDPPTTGWDGTDVSDYV